LVANSTIIETDDPSGKILKFGSKNKVDLISIMSDQEGGAARLLGQFAHHIIHDSKIPVITFKPLAHEVLNDNSMGGLW